MRITILFGGTNKERLVSVASAQALHRALPEADLWFWHLADTVHDVKSETLLNHKRPFEDAFEPGPVELHEQPDQLLGRRQQQVLAPVAVKDREFFAALPPGVVLAVAKRPAAQDAFAQLDRPPIESYRKPPHQRHGEACGGTRQHLGFPLRQLINANSLRHLKIPPSGVAVSPIYTKATPPV